MKRINTKGGGEKPIAIQGYEGSFHQVAARLFFGKEVEILPCATFVDLIKEASNKKNTRGGVMAIENSIAGSIMPNYNLLQKSKTCTKRKQNNYGKSLLELVLLYR